jgi:hypothetical protein
LDEGNLDGAGGMVEGDQRSEMDGRTAGVDSANTGVDVENVNEKDDEGEERGANGPNLRPRGEKTDPTHILRGYGQNDFLFALMDADASFSFLTEQMSMKKGLKHFQKKGVEALLAEMSQLHYRNTIKPVFADSMTREQKLQALRYLMFLKEKRCGRIKARGCADGRKQRLWKTKEETSSPTVRTHSLFLTAIIAALEGRKVVTVDISRSIHAGRYR